jgi:hypothetical protein
VLRAAFEDNRWFSVSCGFVEITLERHEWFSEHIWVMMELDGVVSDG